MFLTISRLLFITTGVRIQKRSASDKTLRACVYAIYRVVHNKVIPNFHTFITSWNVSRFSKSFHWPNLWQTKKNKNCSRPHHTL